MRRFARPVVLCAFAVVAACALPTRDEYASGSRKDPALDGGQLDRADGATPAGQGDAASTSDAVGPQPGIDGGNTDAATDPPLVNLLSPNNGTFESSCSDDSGYYESNLSISDVARSGSHSCLVCHANENDNIWSIDNGFDVHPSVGQTYRAIAWVRRPPGTTVALPVRIALRSQTKSYAQIEEAESETAILSDDWQRISVDLTIRKPAALMDTFTFGRPDDASMIKTCFLVDDYVVALVK